MGSGRDFRFEEAVHEHLPHCSIHTIDMVYSICPNNICTYHPVKLGNGQNGTNGSDGADGKSVIVTSTPAGAACSNGGTTLTFGYDNNNDGDLISSSQRSKAARLSQRSAKRRKQREEKEQRRRQALVLAGEDETYRPVDSRPVRDRRHHHQEC